MLCALNAGNLALCHNGHVDHHCELLPILPVWHKTHLSLPTYSCPTRPKHPLHSFLFLLFFSRFKLVPVLVLSEGVFAWSRSNSPNHSWPRPSPCSPRPRLGTSLPPETCDLNRLRQMSFLTITITKRQCVHSCTQLVNYSERTQAHLQPGKKGPQDFNFVLRSAAESTFGDVMAPWCSCKKRRASCWSPRERPRPRALLLRFPCSAAPSHVRQPPTFDESACVS